ncbi:MAG: hypothetical protein IEMM0002_0503 [bacterium]|nr:MAG: hypothetical protein IEMM0002_0503 [bacterium]
MYISNIETTERANRRLRILLSSLVILVAALLFQRFTTGDIFINSNPQLTTVYQAVHLDNGEIYYGTLENPNTPFIIMRDVFYFAVAVDENGQKSSTVFIKRESELHSPKGMYINSKRVLLIEPVSPSSKVAYMIRELKSKAGAEKKSGDVDKHTQKQPNFTCCDGPYSI